MKSGQDVATFHGLLNVRIWEMVQSPVHTAVSFNTSPLKIIMNCVPDPKIKGNYFSFYKFMFVNSIK